MATQDTRVNRAQTKVATIRKALREVEAEFEAIISEGGGTLSGALAWLNAADPALPAGTVAKLGAARTAVLNLRAALSADSNTDEIALAQFEA